jgi:hypothetical protein
VRAAKSCRLTVIVFGTPVPLLVPRGRGLEPRRVSIRLGRRHPASGVTPVNVRHRPAVKTPNPLPIASSPQLAPSVAQGLGSASRPQRQLMCDSTPIANGRRPYPLKPVARRRRLIPRPHATRPPRNLPAAQPRPRCFEAIAHRNAAPPFAPRCWRASVEALSQGSTVCQQPFRPRTQTRPRQHDHARVTAALDASRTASCLIVCSVSTRRPPARRGRGPIESS